MTSKDTLLVDTSLDNVFMIEGFNSFQKAVTIIQENTTPDLFWFI